MGSSRFLAWHLLKMVMIHHVQELEALLPPSQVDLLLTRLWLELEPDYPLIYWALPDDLLELL